MVVNIEGLLLSLLLIISTGAGIFLINLEMRRPPHSVDLRTVVTLTVSIVIVILEGYCLWMWFTTPPAPVDWSNSTVLLN